MKTLSFGGLVALIAVVVTVLSCTPQAAPTPPMPKTVVSTPQITTLEPPSNNSPEEQAWAKVVEAAKKEAEVTAYSFDYVGDVGLKLSAAFKNRYGIRLNIVTGRGSEFLERLRTEKRLGQIVADMAEGSATILLNMKLLGLTAPVPDLPVLREKDVWELNPLVIDQEAHIITPVRTVWSAWVNTNLVKPGEEPKLYQDLLKPQWKGKIVASDPNLDTTMYTYFVPLIRANILTWDYVKALGSQQLSAVMGTVQNATMVSRGEYPFSLMNTDNVVAPFIAEGAPVKAVSYQEGIVESVVPVAAIQGGPHPNATKVLINWLLSEEGQTIYGKGKSAAMVRKGVPDFRPPNARAPATRRVVMTTADLDEQAKLFRERFIEKLWGK